ncbi:ANTAR domain-containing protein [Geodermatophilus sp. SYSU D00867]
MQSAAIPTTMLTTSPPHPAPGGTGWLLGAARGGHARDDADAAARAVAHDLAAVLPERCGVAVTARVQRAPCLPLDTGSEVVGALPVYVAGPGPGPERATPTAVAGHAAPALLSGRRTAHLGVALDSRDVVGQAEGVLVERHRITADTAFGVLVRASQDTGREVRDVARLVTETGEAPAGTPADGPR